MSGGVDRSRWRLSRGVAASIAVVLAIFLVAAAGVAYATIDYTKQYAGRILPGATIAGVSVGGMRADEAVEAVRAGIAPQLERQIDIEHRNRTWSTTPRKLGAESNAEKLVDAALRRSREAGFFDRMQMSLLGDDFGFRRDVAITYPRQGAKGFIEGIASGFNRKPRAAGIDYSSGWVELTEARPGRKVLVGKSRWKLLQALQNGEDTVELAVKRRKPKITEDAFDQVLLVRIGENKLYLYQNGKITHSWPVATGQPEYPTPTGIYEVTLKRYMPTWVNPDPDGWGADMPESIPPGPGNPLGLRALNWSASAIRFHGTQATYSLGYNASHGCVRLSNDDAIELYNLVQVGTPIVSTVVAPLKPLYSSAPDPTLVPSEDGTSGKKKKSG